MRIDIFLLVKNYAHLTIDNVIFLTFVEIILLILIIHIFLSSWIISLDLFGNSNDNFKWKYNRNEKRKVP